jgi:predicted nuclease with TOPRIM domain
MTKAQEITPKVHLDDLHFEHEQWKRELDFLKGEYQFFSKRLEEVAARYTNQEVLKELEQFQNQIYLHKNAIDELLHNVNSHEHELATYAQAHPVAIDHVLFDDHKPLREQVEINRNIVAQFKANYQRFLAKWM